jgi:hypothetical protein
MKFTNLFAKKDLRIEALKAAVEENKKARAWCFAFSARRDKLEEAVADAKATFFRNPSDATAEAVLQSARVFHPVEQALFDLMRLAWQVEEPNQPGRLLAVIQPALDAVVERLEEILKGIEKTDHEKAETLAMEHDDVKSPVRDRIATVIGEARDFKMAIESGKLDRLNPAVDFVLTRGSEARTPEIFVR